MANIITRTLGDTAKNDALTYEELDQNFVNLNNDTKDLYSKLGYDNSGFISHSGYTNNGDGTITLPSNEVLLYSNSEFLGYPDKYTVNSATTGVDLADIVEGATNYIYADYADGTPIYNITTDRESIDWATKAPYITVFRDGVSLSVVSWDSYGVGLPNKITDRLIRISRFEFEEHPVIQETTNREFTLSDAHVWNGANSTYLEALDSAINQLSFWYHSSGIWTRSPITQYNNLEYDNGTDLIPLNPNTFAINWVYRCVCADNKFAILLANAPYATLTAAMYAAPPKNVPQNITTQATLVGRIIVQQGATTASKIDSAPASDFKTLSLLSL